MENARVEYNNNIKHSLVLEEMEKGKLRKHLQKKEEEITSLQKELKSNGAQVDITASRSHAISAPQESKDITSLLKKLRLLKVAVRILIQGLKIKNSICWWYR